VVRILTVLVGLATAAITLGPRDWVVAGRSGTESWLLLHPSLGRIVEQLGGVEPAGNLVLFAPFAALLALAVGLRFLPIAFLLLLAAPIAVEWTQRYLPGRVPDGGDIVRNTTGLLVAFVAVALVRLAARLLRVAVRR
jgi:glycopeptide antibiotics resistance protein